MKNSDNNIIGVIEERLKQLEMEKESIENKYGIDENFLKEFNDTDKKKKNKKTNSSIINNKKISTGFENLPKLDMNINSNTSKYFYFLLN